MSLFVSTLAASTASGGTGGSAMYSFVLMIGLIALMYFIMVRPQRKRQKQEQAMREAIEVGDEITTIGGICGRVVTVKDNNIIIETGADRNKLKMEKWAIQSNNTKLEQARRDNEAAREAAKAAKEEKTKGKKKKLTDTEASKETKTANQAEKDIES